MTVQLKATLYIQTKHMQICELFITALSALRSNILRTLLTMLGIIIGIAAVILIISLGQGATKAITDQISSFGTNLVIIFPGSLSQGPSGTAGVKTLTVADAEAILNTNPSLNIQSVSPVVTRSFLIIANGQHVNASVQGVGEPYGHMQSLTVTQGTFITDDYVSGLSRVAVLGPQVALDLFGEDAEVVGQIVKIDNRSFRVVGITEPKGTSGFTNVDEYVYVPYSTAMKVLLGQDFVQTILVETKNTNIIDQTMENIRSLLITRHKIADGADPDFSLRSSKDALSTLGTVTGLLTSLLAGIAAISLVVGGIGIMNIMLVTVTERTKEVGLLKALGAKRRDILLQFLIESVVLTVSGGAIGIAIGVGATYGITKVANIPFIVSASSLALAVGVSTIVGLIFGIYPAKKAADLQPIDALRYE